MTYAEARQQGYKGVDTAWQRGYVSRKVNTDNLPVQQAGGNRKGQLYVLVPSFKSSSYCIRQYLAK